jgi:microcystin-dependent protein
MSQPYLGEIRMFAGNFAPRYNAYCAGQLMSIQQNSALFSLLGTYYGGDGTTTFALPDFRGRIPVSMGQGNALSNYNIGQQTGTESVTIVTGQMPMHNHMMMVSSSPGNLSNPVGNMPATLQAPLGAFWVPPDKAAAPAVAMDPAAISMVGNNLPHENRMPAMAISIIIALNGVFPSRN